MLEQILTSLSNGLSQSLGWALLAAFAWGVVSIVFSPCHLASVPLVVGFISTQEDASTKRALPALDSCSRLAYSRPSR